MSPYSVKAVSPMLARGKSTARTGACCVIGLKAPSWIPHTRLRRAPSFPCRCSVSDIVPSVIVFFASALARSAACLKASAQITKIVKQITWVIMIGQQRSKLAKALLRETIINATSTAKKSGLITTIAMTQFIIRIGSRVFGSCSKSRLLLRISYQREIRRALPWRVRFSLEPSADGERDVRSFDRGALTALPKRRSSSAQSIGPIPRASSWAINSCNRPLFKASDKDNMLDSLTILACDDT
jgi:hypothetical protein